MKNKIDLFTRLRYIVPTLAPVWSALPAERRGKFYVGEAIYEYAVSILDHTGDVIACHDSKPPDTAAAVLCASYGDMARIARMERRVVLMQHGIGHTFGLPAYADGGGRNADVDLFLAPSRYVARKISERNPNAKVEVIGSPKTDSHPMFDGEFPVDLPKDKKQVVIAFACHWGDRTNKPQESGSAWEFYVNYLEAFAKELESKGHKLIGHSHPSTKNERKRIFENAGIEYIDTFEEVMKRADIYINDLSSTLYEFILTGKPVIVLNAPWFRREKEFGIRFWDYSEIGINVETPEGLCPAVTETIRNYKTIRAGERVKAISDLFPYRGASASRAYDVLVRYLEGIDSIKPIEEPKVRYRVLPAESGVLYMCFGEKAKEEMRESINSLREKSGGVPVVVIGDRGLEGEQFIEWKGESPFDPKQMRNFQFRAGRIKPHFYDLTPFKRTLYMDCDTRVEQDITGGFGYLDSYDFCVAQERHTILELYNVEKGRWYHDMKEREYTIDLFGGNGNFPFINSGVFLWRQCDRAGDLFRNWAEEWKRFQQWDEQAALLRALNMTLVKYLVLAESWNYPHRNNSKVPPVITHMYGRGMARSNS